jgi:FtsP/CotA-like multicopper oxidase with cupredoxin domain
MIFGMLLCACGLLQSQQEPAVLKGSVTVGPLTPVEHPDATPMPVPPEVYTSRAVNIYKADGETLVETVHFNTDGTYEVELKPGTYVVALPPGGIEYSKQLPQTVTLKTSETFLLNFDIDTGIR